MHPVDARNLEFYELVANRFSQSRSGPWRGWANLDLPPGSVTRVLDAGCGNGRLYGYLRDHASGALDYLGVDFSPSLLRRAKERTGPLRRPNDQVEWRQSDIHTLGSPMLEPFDRIYLFGVLHHVAERARREELLRRLGRLLRPHGQLWVTAWRFGEGEGYRPPPADAAPPEEPRAAWLSFDGVGERYCVSIETTEIDEYPESCDLVEERRFHADGRTGRLNLYLVYRRRLDADEVST